MLFDDDPPPQTCRHRAPGRFQRLARSQAPGRISGTRNAPLHRARIGPDAVHLDRQSLSWLRIWLQILLRPLRARIHGTARSGAVRAQDLRQTISSPRVSGRSSAAEIGRHRLDRHCHRSLSTGRTALPDHPPNPGSVRRASAGSTSASPPSPILWRATRR